MCYYGELPDIHNRQIVTARKEHRCCECRGVIGKGEKYESFWGVWGGRADTFKTCMGCLDIRDVVREHEDAMGCDPDESMPPFGDLISSWHEIEHENNRAMAE